MSRVLYQVLLWLHPHQFRKEFASEMLWIFDEAAAHGIAPLFGDVIISLLRQWVVRDHTWKIVSGAILGALLELAFVLSRIEIPLHLR